MFISRLPEFYTAIMTFPPKKCSQFRGLVNGGGLFEGVKGDARISRMGANFIYSTFQFAKIRVISG
jgi:hypothetical protein